jgi:hypothetical protein
MDGFRNEPIIARLCEKTGFDSGRRGRVCTIGTERVLDMGQYMGKVLYERQNLLLESCIVSLVIAVQPERMCVLRVNQLNHSNALPPTNKHDLL